MAVALLNQTFNAGVISRLMSARPDQQRYQAGCDVLHNMVPLPQGPATRRPGFKYLGAVGETTISNPVRVVPFVFSTTESRVLEVGVGYIRVWNGDDIVESGGSPYEVTTSYTASEIPTMTFAQSADVVYIASAGRAPAKLSRFADDNWVLETVEFIPQTEVPTNLAVSNTTGVGSSGQKTYRYVVTAIDNTTGEESLPSDEVSIVADILNKTDGNYNDLTWDANTVEPLEYRVYKYEAGVFGYIGTEVGSAASPTFTDDNIAADTEDAPPNAENPFNATGDYPSIAFFWQQRLGWAATDNQPFTIWLSPSAQLESLAASVPPADDDAIEATLATSRANRIQWIEADQSLVMGTTGNEWVIGSTDNEPLTPSNVSFKRQGSKGSERIPAISTGDSVIFLQRGGQAVREFSYAFASDKYESPDLSITSTNILDNETVVSWAYQLNPYSVVWMALSDGTLASMTYNREHQVIGWATHDTDGVVEDICCVPGENYDRVYVVVRRVVNGSAVRYIERMKDYFIRSDDPVEAWFLDSGVRYNGAATKTLTNIAPHLVGEEVRIWADGAEQPPKTVQAGGTVELDAEASNAIVGLRYTSDITPTRPELTIGDGVTMSRVYKVSNAKLRMYKSMGVRAGSSADELEDVLLRNSSDPLSPKLASEDITVIVDTGWTEEWNFLVRSKSPGPFTLLAVVYETEIGDA